jgi:hypothetical protein
MARAERRIPLIGVLTFLGVLQYAPRSSVNANLLRGASTFDVERSTLCELRHNEAFKFSVEVGLLPDLFLDACLRGAHAMGDVHRHADFVGGRR